MNQKTKTHSTGIKWINILIFALIIYFFLRPFIVSPTILFIVLFSMLALFIGKNKHKKKNDAISHTRNYAGTTHKKDEYRDYKKEGSRKTKHIKEEASYTYTTSHTEAKINETRNLPFQGTLYLDNIDIGSAIGLIKLANKLVGIKDITLQLTTGKGTIVMGIEANDEGKLKLKVQAPSTAIKILRKAYSDYNTTNVSGEIRLRYTKGNEVKTLLEIAQDIYKAKIQQ